jgi:hypothetical protein
MAYMKQIDLRLLLAIGFFLTQLTSCAVTTRATEGSSDTFVNTTEASSKFTSSTFPRSKNEGKAEAVLKYARANFSRIRADIAVGQGEHLASLAVLLEIKDANKDAFFALTKQQFTTLFSSSNTTAENFIKELNIIHSQFTKSS